MQTDTVAATSRQMDSATTARLFTAARRAKVCYPGAVGELLSQELLSWMVFGHRLGSDLIMRVTNDLEEPRAQI